MPQKQTKAFSFKYSIAGNIGEIPTDFLKIL